MILLISPCATLLVSADKSLFPQSFANMVSTVACSLFIQTILLWTVVLLIEGSGVQSTFTFFTSTDSRCFGSAIEEVGLDKE